MVTSVSFCGQKVKRRASQKNARLKERREKWSRKRERGRDRSRERDRQTERDRERQRETGRDAELDAELCKSNGPQYPQDPQGLLQKKALLTSEGSSR